MASVYMALVPVLVATVLLSACSPKSPDALIEDARQALAKGDTSTAVVTLKSVLSAKPDSVDARRMLAQALLAAGDASGSAVELRKVLDARPDLDSVFPLYAKSLNASRQSSKVISELGAMELQDQSAQAELLGQVAWAQLALGKRKEAGQTARTSVEIGPKSATALHVQARLAAIDGQADRALQLLESAVEVDPKDALLHLTRGLIHQQVKRDTEAAKAAFSQAVAVEPRLLEARSALVALQITTKDLKGAKEQLSFFQSLGKDHVLAVLVEAQIAYAEKDYDKALSRIQVALKSHPDTFQVVSLAGMIQLQKRLLSQAERNLAHALQLQPNNATVAQHLAQAYLRTGQNDKALETLRPLLARQKVSASTLAMAGAAHLGRGDQEKAVASLTDAVRLNPKDPMARTQLALAQSKSLPLGQTVAELRAISAEDQSTVADLALVSVLLEARRFDEALAAVDAIEKKDPKSPIAPNLRGYVVLQRGDRALARQHFEKALATEPNFFPALTSLATLDVAEGRSDAAIARYEALLKQQPGHAGAGMALARLLAASPSAKGRAATVMAATVRASPGTAAPRLQLIEHLLAVKDPRAALTAAQEADAAIPNHPDLLDALGRAQFANKQTQAAIATYGKLVALQPGSVQAHTRLAGAYLAADDKRAAEQSLRKALTIDAEFVPAQQALISLVQADNRFDEALAIARTVMKQRPDSPVGYLMAGAIEVNRGNHAAAAGIYRDGLKRVADTKVAATLYSTLIKASQAAEADRFSKQWLVQHPQDVEFLAFLADTAMAGKDWASAERHFQALLQQKPDDVATLNNLAWISVQQNRRGALKYAERASQLRPDAPGVFDTLASAYALEGDLGRALEAQKKAISLAPNDQGLRLHLAKIHLQRGDKDGARTELLALQKLGDRIPVQPEVERLLKEAR